MTFDDEFYVETDVGSSGAFRETYAPDPTFVPPPFLGFRAADVDLAAVQHVADVAGVTFAEAAAACQHVMDAAAVDRAPLLWDGDQA